MSLADTAWWWENLFRIMIFFRIGKNFYASSNPPGVHLHPLLPLVALEGHNVHQVVIGHLNF